MHSDVPDYVRFKKRIRPNGKMDDTVLVLRKIGLSFGASKEGVSNYVYVISTHSIGIKFPYLNPNTKYVFYQGTMKGEIVWKVTVYSAYGGAGLTYVFKEIEYVHPDEAIRLQLLEDL